MTINDVWTPEERVEYWTLSMKIWERVLLTDPYRAEDARERLIAAVAFRTQALAEAAK
jgi:hypothetical protein